MAVTSLEDTETLLSLSRAKVKGLWEQLKSRQGNLKTIGDVDQALSKYLDWLQEESPEVHKMIIDELRAIRLSVISDKELASFKKT